jgi:hypothetical protein
MTFVARSMPSFQVRIYQIFQSDTSNDFGIGRAFLNDFEKLMTLLQNPRASWDQPSTNITKKQLPQIQIG